MKIRDLGKPNETNERWTSCIIWSGPQINTAAEGRQSETSLLSLRRSKRPVSPKDPGSLVRVWTMCNPFNRASKSLNSCGKMICLAVRLLQINLIFRWSSCSAMYRSMLSIGVIPIPPAIMMISLFPISLKWLNSPNGPLSETLSPGWRSFNLRVQSPVVRITNSRKEVLVGLEAMVNGCSSFEICGEKSVMKPNCPGIWPGMGWVFEMTFRQTVSSPAGSIVEIVKDLRWSRRVRVLIQRNKSPLRPMAQKAKSFGSFCVNVSLTNIIWTQKAMTIKIVLARWSSHQRWKENFSEARQWLEITVIIITRNKKRPTNSGQ